MKFKNRVEEHDYYYNLAIKEAEKKYLHLEDNALLKELSIARSNCKDGTHQEVADCEVIYKELKKRELERLA